MPSLSRSLFAVVAALTLPAAALAQPAGPPGPPPSAARQHPYSVPWQLRPAAAITVLRSDTTVALYEDAASRGGTTVATTLLASYRLTPRLSPLVRLGFVSNSPPTGDAGVSLVNPVLGATYVQPLGSDLRLALFLGAALPLGMGGGDAPNSSTTAAASGINARSAMDNAMFAVNYLTFFPGASIAYVRGGLTVQFEATLLELIRVRGENVDRDEARTNLTLGLHLGYFLVPQLSVGLEARYQVWLSTPSFVAATPARRDTLTVAAGPRAHFRVGSAWFRPGVAYARGLDDPMSGLNYHIVQLDLPVIF
jgi:hypothetical protein